MDGKQVDASRRAIVDAIHTVCQAGKSRGPADHLEGSCRIRLEPPASGQIRLRPRWWPACRVGRPQHLDLLDQLAEHCPIEYHARLLDTARRPGTPDGQRPGSRHRVEQVGDGYAAVASATASTRQRRSPIWPPRNPVLRHVGHGLPVRTLNAEAEHVTIRVRMPPCRRVQVICALSTSPNADIELNSVRVEVRCRQQDCNLLAPSQHTRPRQQHRHLIRRHYRSPQLPLVRFPDSRLVAPHARRMPVRAGARSRPAIHSCPNSASGSICSARAPERVRRQRAGLVRGWPAGPRPAPWRPKRRTWLARAVQREPLRPPDTPPEPRSGRLMGLSGQGWGWRKQGTNRRHQA
jgi:hypothetical protein